MKLFYQLLNYEITKLRNYLVIQEFSNSRAVNWSVSD